VKTSSIYPCFQALPAALTALGLTVVTTISAAAQPRVVTPFVPSPDYIEQGVLLGVKSGSHRAAFTTQFTGEPAVTIRPLSVRPDSSLNGELISPHSARLGPRALPPVFGGFTSVVFSMKEPSPYTTRIQFHDGPSGRNDFLNLHVYLESKQAQPAGLEFSFTGALLLPAGDAGSALVVPLEKIAQASFVTASQRPYARTVRVLVRDADGGDFYVSENFATEPNAALSLTGGRWAKLNPADLTLSGEYRPATFQRIDHIGIYAVIPATEITHELPAHGVICNLALHSFKYALSP
jgi:hypothetical protein